MTRALLRSLLGLALAALAIGAASCASDFDAISKLNSVRMLGTQIDKPYAKPGDTVTMTTLAYDARPDKTRTMTISWIPLLCENPTDDLYYLCFQQFFAGVSGGDGGVRDGGGGGAGGGLLGALKPGVDLTGLLPTGPTYSVTLPTDIIAKHPIVAGSTDVYGLGIVFNIACAGHVEITALSQSSVQQVPIGCFDDQHNQLGSKDFVIGIQRVYAYADRTNANPIIDHATYQGQTIDLTQGISVAKCEAAKREQCPDLMIDVIPTDASWELNPGDTDQNGNVRHEQLWADYYSDIGDYSGDARLLFDPVAGRITDTATKFHGPNDPGTGFAFIVVHDNRGGTAWLQFPVRVE